MIHRGEPFFVTSRLVWSDDPRLATGSEALDQTSLIIIFMNRTWILFCISVLRIILIWWNQTFFLTMYNYNCITIIVKFFKVWHQNFQICGTRIDKKSKKIIKVCTAVCNSYCDKRACIYCCNTPGCNESK